MSNLLYLIAVVLVILWALGKFSFHAGNMIHILLVIAVIAVLFGSSKVKLSVLLIS